MVIEETHTNAVITGIAVEVIKSIPLVNLLLAGMEAYQKSVADEQREKFLRSLEERLEELKENREWYKREDSKTFTKKAVTTALNAEFDEKMEFLINAFFNGPTLGLDEGSMLKHIEEVRQISKPALEVLVASLRVNSNTGQVNIGLIARFLDWKPELVDACVSELHAHGVFSSTLSWRDAGDRGYQRKGFTLHGEAGMTEYTKEFAMFISR
ncbi:MAG: hypothetical protein ACTSYJ_02410 [Candidatus Thorarchaeota archaeon]